MKKIILLLLLMVSFAAVAQNAADANKPLMTVAFKDGPFDRSLNRKASPDDFITQCVFFKDHVVFVDDKGNIRLFVSIKGLVDKDGATRVITADPEEYISIANDYSYLVYSYHGTHIFYGAIDLEKTSKLGR